ncbi:tetratricopeptide repeat protein [Hymenobacter sp. BT188]|uniref:tetratricopeptide repeat protein n=1 Tax=Hymenobacter sp. BT188 TaxID=2763504 RepID=UPI0016512946|nr:tetratricopeptide repeat protein [Hymenobacter sp. BT188]MBC6606942.1 tetratricopeptide repeat protein [Hymenobacter sp. BT188]
MTIHHPLNEFLYSLFPKAQAFGQNPEQLIDHLTDFYTFGPYRPTVTIQGDRIEVRIDTQTIHSQQAEYQKILRLCEAGQFRQALPRLRKLIELNPTISEYQRVLGQVLSELGQPDAALDALIDALRWDPRNGYALIMAGNIYARQKQDLKAAKTFYDQALALNPRDFIAINNMGSNLLQSGRPAEAERYFEIAHEIEPTYPNTLYALAMVRQQRHDYAAAFELATRALRYARPSDPILRASLALATETATKYLQNILTYSIVTEYQERVENLAGKEIRVEGDPLIPMAAKLEIAEIYGCPYHQIKFKSNYPAVEHLIMHELVHLDFVLQARAARINQLFTTTSESKEKFLRAAEPQLKKLRKAGYQEQNVANFVDSIFEGMMRQVYNAPIDLFIEDFLYKEFPKMRPLQFLSLYKLLQEYIEAARSKQVAEFSPPPVHKANTVLNLVMALQFCDLFGYNAVPDFDAPATQVKEAERLWNEYLEYRADRQAGEEYELVQHWGEDLDIAAYFKLQDEQAVHAELQGTDIGPMIPSHVSLALTNEPTKEESPVEEVLRRIEQDPLGLEEAEPADAHLSPLSLSNSPAGGMAVMFYCLDWLKHFDGKSREQVQAITYEIALLGRSGLDPKDSSQRYSLASVPGKRYSALHLLTGMYTGFQQLDPSLNTGLDFSQELAMARNIHEGTDE